MTKSEAKAIEDALGRGIRSIGVDLPWHMLGREQREALSKALAIVNDEMVRVYDMAAAELTGGGK